MITLLLTFFVLMISMSSMGTMKMTSAAEAVRRIADGETRQTTKKSVVPSLRDGDIERAKRRKENGVSEDPLAARRSLVAVLLKDIKGIEILPTKDGLSVSMNETLLFPPGSAVISSQGKQALNQIGEVINRADVSVCVEGHTDSTPIDSRQYPTNWELSLARAANVVRWLAEKGTVNPERLSVAGYADIRPRMPNDSERNRQVNRRVDIVLTFPKF
jgi:chemotaxis protein MotB